MGLKFKLVIVLIAVIIGLGPAMLHAQEVGSPTVSAGSTPVSILPEHIQKRINTRLVSSEDTGAKGPFFSHDFFELDADRLLILLGLSDYIGSSSSTFLPLVVEKKGVWHAGPFLSGAPTALDKTPDGALWLTTQWQIEGTYPELYRSVDGLSWTPISLPENRNVDCCFEYLEKIHADQGRLFLFFKSDTTDVRRCWSVGYNGLGRAKPVWREVPCGANDGLPSLIVPVSRGDWVRDEKSDPTYVLFRSSQWPISVALPKER